MTREGILKHKEVFNKWLDGAEIQFLSNSNEWIDLKNPKWYTGFKYRVKPTNIEFKDCSFNEEEYGVNTWGRIAAFTIEDYDIEHRKCFIKDKEIADAYAVLPQLIRLRDEYNDGWKPDWNNKDIKYTIEKFKTDLIASTTYNSTRLISFKSEETRDRFFEDHKDLIETAKPFL